MLNLTAMIKSACTEQCVKVLRVIIVKVQRKRRTVYKISKRLTFLDELVLNVAHVFTEVRVHVCIIKFERETINHWKNTNTF